MVLICRIALVSSMVLLAGCRTLSLGYVRPSEKPVSAWIVRPYLMEQSVRPVEKEQWLAELDELFPGYRRLPVSTHAGDWLAKYIIHVDFAGGRAVRIVSDGHYWSTGRGDWRVGGDFEAFIQKALAR